MIDEWGGAIYTDLLNYYGVDLRDLFRPGGNLDPLLVLTLIHYLPADSAYVAERRGGQQFRGWDDGRYLDAIQATELRTIAWMYASAHSDRKPKPPNPIPIPDHSKKRSRDGGMFAQMAEARIQAARRRKGSG